MAENNKKPDTNASDKRSLDIIRNEVVQPRKGESLEEYSGRMQFNKQTHMSLGNNHLLNLDVNKDGVFDLTDAKWVSEHPTFQAIVKTKENADRFYEHIAAQATPGQPLLTQEECIKRQSMPLRIYNIDMQDSVPAARGIIPDEEFNAMNITGDDYITRAEFEYYKRHNPEKQIARGNLIEVMDPIDIVEAVDIALEKHPELQKRRSRLPALDSGEVPVYAKPLETPKVEPAMKKAEPKKKILPPIEEGTRPASEEKSGEPKKEKDAPPMGRKLFSSAEQADDILPVPADLPRAARRRGFGSVV